MAHWTKKKPDEVLQFLLEKFPELDAEEEDETDDSEEEEETEDSEEEEEAEDSEEEEEAEESEEESSGDERMDALLDDVAEGIVASSEEEEESSEMDETSSSEESSLEESSSEPAPVPAKRKPSVRYSHSKIYVSIEKKVIQKRKKAKRRKA